MIDNYPFDLGHWSRKISTESSEAQRWFDRGLNWTYGYNHEEAVVCFTKATKADANCAMAWWGIAYAGGPFYNRPWIRYSENEVDQVLPFCRRAVEKAVSLSEKAIPQEQALIQALERRYQNKEERNTAVLASWQEDFADLMREVQQRFSEDPDIASLYIEAAVTCTPRQLWDLHSGEIKPTSRMAEVLPVLDHWMAQIERENLNHPGLLHMHIHALEMSPVPERSLNAADRLRGLTPDAGHLEHMSAHVYVLCGDYAQSVRQSERSVAADDKYLAYAGDDNFYTTARCHDLHLFMYTAMFLGQYQKAIYAADRMKDMARDELLASSPPFMASILEGYAAMRIHVLVRFGKWQELAELPAPTNPQLRPIGTAMRAYGRGVAFAALGQINQAETARKELLKAITKFPQGAIFLSNSLQDMLSIATAMLDGELNYRKGKYDEAFDCLRTAVRRDDNLNYTEPWAWMHPPRHALGALLAEQEHYDEAISVFRSDLGLDQNLPRCCQHPDNIWALVGLNDSLRKSGRQEERQLLRQRLELAKARADTTIETACFCSQT